MCDAKKDVMGVVSKGKKLNMYLMRKEWENALESCNICLYT